MFGLLNIHKPVGPTSHDVVARVRRLIGRKTKVGHAGTLDPFAEGVLLVCVGHATRLASMAADHDKQYEATVAFGAASTTDDPTGELTPSDAPAPTAEAIRAVLDEFTGVIEQVPPAHSAVHVNGQRAYRLARADQPVDLPARRVRIDRIELLSWEPGRARLRVDCGKGTYIRALARDLGRRLDCPAYCAALTRTAIGAFTLDRAVALDALTAETVAAALLPARLAVADWPTASLDADALNEISMGRAVPCPTAPPPGTTDVAAVDEAGELVALCVYDAAAGVLRPKKVFIAR